MPRIQLKRYTASEFTVDNPVLSVAEVGFETDTKKQKIGDGTTAWNSLAYGSDASKAPLLSPSFTTPFLEVASATSVNKVTLTTPATGSTLTIADGKTATINNTVTLTATDGSALAIGTGGTLGTAAYTAATAYEASGAIATHAALTTGVHGLGTMSQQNTGTYAGPGSAQAFATGPLTVTGAMSATAVLTLSSAGADATGTISFTGDADARIAWDRSGKYLNYIWCSGTAGTGNNFMGFAAGNSEVIRITTGVGLAVTGDVSVSTKTPASAAATGVSGTITWDASYVYVCTATNTWKRVAIATW